MGTSSSVLAGEVAAARAAGRGGEVTCRQGMGTSSSLTWSGAPDTQGTWGLQQETRDLGSGWGDTTGEPRRTEVTEAGGSSIASKAVAVTVVGRVEQACAGGWEESRGREKHTYNMSASISNSNEFVKQTVLQLS
jgi:hypothetical protein